MYLNKKIDCGYLMVNENFEELPVKNLIRNEIRLRGRTAHQQHAVT